MTLRLPTIATLYIATLYIVSRYKSRNKCDQRNERQDGSEVLHDGKREDVCGIQRGGQMRCGGMKITSVHLWVAFILKRERGWGSASNVKRLLSISISISIVTVVSKPGQI